MRSFYFSEYPTVIKGAGELASGVAIRLWRAGFPVVMTELENPLTIRRSVSFSEAVYTGDTVVEEVRATRVFTDEAVRQKWEAGILPVLVDAAAEIVGRMHPVVVVDGRMAKINLGTHREEASLVIGLGPGFTAGQDVNVVIETNRGHFLGRVFREGNAETDTHTPGEMAGVSAKRVFYAPCEGYFTPVHQIGDRVSPGEILGYMGNNPVITHIGGIVRGLIHPGVNLQMGTKIGDVDPRMRPEFCTFVSEKALAIGGGVLEAILEFINTEREIR